MMRTRDGGQNLKIIYDMMKNIVDYIKNINEGNGAGLPIHAETSYDIVCRSYNNLFPLSNTICRKIDDGLYVITGSALRMISYDRDAMTNINSFIYGSAGKGTVVISGAERPVTVSTWAGNRGLGLYLPNGEAVARYAPCPMVPNSIDDAPCTYDRLCATTMGRISEVIKDNDYIVACVPSMWAAIEQ